MFHKGDFVYADPPYLIACATYNEQGGWGEREERALFDFLDELDKRGVPFALSNVLRSKGRPVSYTHLDVYKRQVLDSSCEGQGTIIVSAGKIGHQVELSPADLMRVCGASLAPLTLSG